MRTPRVLHVFESWPPLVTGYASRSAMIVRHQAAEGVAAPIVLVSSRQHMLLPGGEAEPPAEVVMPSGFELVMRRVRPYTLDEGHLCRAIVEAASNADLIHVHFSSGIGRAAARAARKVKKPLVAEIRFDLAGAMTAQSLRGIAVAEDRLRSIFERHLGRADAVTAASSSLARMVIEKRLAPEDRVFVVANGADIRPVDPAAVEALRQELGFGRATVVGTTSGMLHYEGLDRLLSAAATIRGIRVLMVGDGPERARLEALARTLGVDAMFMGARPRTEIPALLGLIDVFAVPRRDLAVTRCASPLKVAEAMAVGSAIVATSLGDVPDLLADGRGVLTPPSDDTAFRDALADLVADPERRRALREATRNHAARALSWSRAAASYGEIYARVVNGHRS